MIIWRHLFGYIDFENGKHRRGHKLCNHVIYFNGCLQKDVTSRIKTDARPEMHREPLLCIVQR